MAWTFKWTNGRQLLRATSGSTVVNYTYDVTGVRDSMTVNGTTYNFITQNGQVVRQTGGGKTLDFIYDNQGRPYARTCDGPLPIFQTGASLFAPIRKRMKLLMFERLPHTP